MAIHGPPALSKTCDGARKTAVPTTMPMMMLTASHKPRHGATVDSGTDDFMAIFRATPLCTPTQNDVILLLFVRLDYGWTFSLRPSIMLQVGSANVSLLAATFVIGCLCLFQPHLLAGLHFWPLSPQPRK